MPFKIYVYKVVFKTVIIIIMTYITFIDTFSITLN